MKPRQRRAALTAEDWWIWSTKLTKDLTDNRALYGTLNQDRRDADLMLYLREARQLCDQHQLLHCVLAGHHTALDAYDDPDTSLVELGLAMRIPKLPGKYR